MFKTPAGAFAAQTSVGRAAATPPDPENWVGRGAVFPSSFNWPVHFLWFTVYNLFSKYFHLGPLRIHLPSSIMISSYHFGMSWTPIHPPWGRVERDRAEWKSFQKSEIRRLNPTFLKTFKCCIPYSVPAIFGFWSICLENMLNIFLISELISKNNFQGRAQWMLIEGGKVQWTVGEKPRENLR